MFSKKNRIIAASICAFIFFIKMSISVTPIFSSILDKNTIFQVVLQLEIENNNSAQSETNEIISKYFNTKSIEQFFNFEIAVENNGKQKHYLKNEKSIQAFHPTVPTPPPNC